MSFTVLGINHKTASVTLRERLAFDAQRYAHASQDICQKTPLHNLVVLSTCNRTEFYTLSDSTDTLLAWLAQYSGIAPEQLSKHTYSYISTEALTHIIRVASGLDSMILGEPQIFGQFKSAINMAQSAGMVNKKLAWLFDQVITATKKVRSETRIGEQAVSLGFAVSQLAKQIFDDLQKNTLVLVAAGEMNQLVARHVCQSGIGKVIICNRSADRAEALAKQLTTDFSVHCDVVALNELATVLPQGDIVCSSTGSLETIIERKVVKRSIKQRRYAPMLMVDLAVPRDIDPRVSKLESVYHYAIDDLQDVIDENKQQRRDASVNAEVMISQVVVDIQTRQRVKEASREIGLYKTLTQQISQDAQTQALQKLTQGKPAEQVIQELAYQLTAKLTHGQFRLLREAASLSDSEAMNLVLSNLLANTQEDFSE